MRCKTCNKEVNGFGRKYCSDKCKSIEYAKRREKNKPIIKGDLNIDYIICKWCNKKVKRIYGGHIKKYHPTKTIKDYKKEFPNSPIMCETDKINTTRHSGQHMKKDKYRKMASEKMKGENNPNHKNKSSKLKRKQCSPFSKEFYIKKGHSESESIKLAKDFYKKTRSNVAYTTQIDYWLNLGYDLETAKEKLKERQSTFTLDKCIKKYGHEKGTQIFKKRQDLWVKKLQKHFIKNGNNRSPASKIANEAISEICRIINIPFSEKEKFMSSKDRSVCYAYDFCFNKKIIEFNGDYWHMNPIIYDNDYFDKRRKKFAHEIRKKDDEKIKLAKSHGYDVLVIWENEYRTNKEKTIKKCINFLNEKHN